MPTIVNLVLQFTNSQNQVCNMLKMTLMQFLVSAPADGANLVHVAAGNKIASLGLGVDKSDAAQIRQRKMQKA